MPIKADCHLHSCHSGDSNTPMEEMVLAAIKKGLSVMCFTEHNDFDYPDSPDGPGSMFLLNPDSYLYDLLKLKEKYANQIKILFGVELGLMPSVARQNAIFAKSHEYDFIIGSSHLVHGKDPYYPPFYEGRSDEEAYREYFESIFENISSFTNYDVYGHLDYVVRYGKTMDRDYCYDKYKDIFDKILLALLDKEKGIELNTGGIKRGMKDFHPCADALKRYKELGGEIITIGSDAHAPQNVADYFDQATEVLKACGFKYYTVFEKRTPEYIKL